jgi:hypothetical protein
MADRASLEKFLDSMPDLRITGYQGNIAEKEKGDARKGMNSESLS